MAGMAGKIGMRALMIVVGIPVGIVTRNAVVKVWAAARPDGPPHDPKQPDVKWTDAIGYAALSAAGVVAAELLTRKGAEQTWRVITGTEPPPPPLTKAEKKLAKAEQKAHKDEERAPVAS